MKKSVKYTGLASLLCFVIAFLMFFGITFIGVILNIVSVSHEANADAWISPSRHPTFTPFQLFLRNVFIPFFQIIVPILLIIASLVLLIIFIILLINSKREQQG